MSQTYDMNMFESELSISQHLNWILDNIYQNYKQGFNTLKEILVLVKSGHNYYQIDHNYNNVIDSVEKNIALWESQYEMFDVKYKSENGLNSDKTKSIETIDCENEIISESIEIKPFISDQTVQTCQQMNTFTTNQRECFDTEWYNNDDIYYMKTLDALTPSSMDQIIATTIKDDMMDSGFEESSISITNCDEINSFVLNNLCNDLEPKPHDIDENFIVNENIHYECIQSTQMCATNTVHTIKKRSHNYVRKSRQVDTRIWYKCGWDGCSFGSFYNGVVKRHSYKKHSGKMKIDKSSNSPMHRFRCDWPGCEVSLVAYHKLVEHKRKHTGEKPFKCKYRACNYATARLYSMIIHERTHKLDPNLSLEFK